MKYMNKLLNLYLPIPLRFVRVTSKAEIYATVAYTQSLAVIIWSRMRSTRSIIFGIFVLVIIIESCSFEISKNLSSAQLDSLKRGDEVYYLYKPKQSNSLDNFEGLYKLKYQDKRLIFYPVGDWKRFDSERRNINAVIKYDSLGFMYKYFETYTNGLKSCDWDYHIDTINNKSYSIENFLMYYDNGELKEKGKRYARIEMKNSELSYFKSFKKFGEWTYYKVTGEFDRTKIYGKIK